MRGKHDLFYLLRYMIGNMAPEICCVKTHDCLKVGDFDRGIVCSHLCNFIVLAIHLYWCEKQSYELLVRRNTNQSIHLPASPLICQMAEFKVQAVEGIIDVGHETIPIFSSIGKTYVQRCVCNCKSEHVCTENREVKTCCTLP